MLNPGERVNLYPRDSAYWRMITGEVLSDDGGDIRVEYPNGTIVIVPWDTVARVEVKA